MGNMLRNSQRLLGPRVLVEFSVEQLFFCRLSNRHRRSVFGAGPDGLVFFLDHFGVKNTPPGAYFVANFLTPLFLVKKPPPKAPFWHLNCYLYYLIYIYKVIIY